MLGRSSVVLLLVACRVTPGPGEGALPGPVANPSCALQDDNALRLDCAITLDAPGPVDLLVMDGELVVRRFASDDTASEHAVTLWGLRAEHTYTVRVVPRSDPGAAWDERITTGALPQNIRLVAPPTGTSGTDAVLFPFQCGGPGHLVLVDTTDGEVLWYQPIIDGTDLPELLKVDGFEYDAERGSIVLLAGHKGVREIDWTGRVLLETGIFYGLERPTHHDVHSRGDLTYALNAAAHVEPDSEYVLDGVYVFGADGEVAATWDLRDHLTPSGAGPASGYWSLEFPGAVDYTHTNGLFVDEAGDWILSSRAMHTILKVVGDPDAPDFGDILWALTTNSGSAFESDFEVVSSGGITDLTFSDQHHANLDADGHLLMFDNGNGAELSRALDIVLDEALGTADIVDTWSLEEHCPIQSSAFRLPGGNVLVTCATSRSFSEFAPGVDAPVWTMKAECADTDDRPLAVRGQPISLD